MEEKMKERPILFSGPMVRAILEGRKTMTRRVLKPQPGEECGTLNVGMFNPTQIDKHGREYAGPEIFGAWNFDGDCGWKCPYGMPGDQLWVKETWAKALYSPKPGSIVYRADGTHDSINDKVGGCWSPSIFMPRGYSRITLEITGVRVERLHAITEEDAQAEGVNRCQNGLYQDYVDTLCAVDTAIESFASLWDSINGIDSWGANPWVWVVEFRRIEK